MNYDNDNKKIVIVKVPKDKTVKGKIVMPKRTVATRRKNALNEKVWPYGAPAFGKVHYTYELIKGGKEEKPSQKKDR